MKFRFVDKITSYRPGINICGVKTVSFEEYQLRKPFSDAPALPESLILESFFQLANWLVVLTSDFSQMTLITEIGQVNFSSRLTPGQAMQLEITVNSYQPDSLEFSGIARSGDQIIASVIACRAQLVNLAEYHNPDDLQVLFSEIFTGNAEHQLGRYGAVNL